MSTRWSDEEDQYLLANYENHDIDFLSQVLDRSDSAIRNRYYRINKKLSDSVSEPPERVFFLERSEQVTPNRLKKIKKGTIETSRLSGWSGKGNPYSHTKTGFRSDLNIVCRSGWEANILRVLKSYGIPYEFEPTVFRFPIKRGNKAYTPDIYLNTTEEWIEVKGYFDHNSKVKMKRFKKYYPEDFAKLIMIISKSSKKARDLCGELDVPIVLHYETIGKLFKSRIDNWEGR